MDPYCSCPVRSTESFIIRLIEKTDATDLFACYHDQAAVQFMNDDNCDFGFYMETPEQMATTVSYWRDFYEKRYFIRFAIVDKATGKAIGTIEGFAGEVGVLRVDIASAYETARYLSQLFDFAKEQFFSYFQDEYLVTKAIPDALERRRALEDCGWESIDTFRTYGDYYRVKTDR